MSCFSGYVHQSLLCNESLNVSLAVVTFSITHYIKKYRAMSNKEVHALAEKIREGLEIAERQMLEEKALRGQDVVVCDDNNNIQRIPASQLL